jgi:hypothetical protein
VTHALDFDGRHLDVVGAVGHHPETGLVEAGVARHLRRGGAGDGDDAVGAGDRSLHPLRVEAAAPSRERLGVLEEAGVVEGHDQGGAPARWHRSGRGVDDVEVPQPARERGERRRVGQVPKVVERGAGQAQHDRPGQVMGRDHPPDGAGRVQGGEPDHLVRGLDGRQ